MLDSLARALGDHGDVSLTLYDSTPQPWRGRAFQQDSDNIIANAPVQAMSIRHGDTAHAERWLTAQGLLTPNTEQERFLPRGIYGDYIADHATRLITELKGQGWQIEFDRTRATGIEPAGPRVYTVISGKGRAEFDYVVLCAGGSVLSNPCGLDGHAGYIANPYPTVQRLKQLPADVSVGVLGSGLTAVDVAVALRVNGHTGPIRLFSRSGVLPFVRRPGPPWSPRHFTVAEIAKLRCAAGALTLADAERLFHQEVVSWGGRARGLFPRPQRRGTRAWLRWQLDSPHDEEDLGTFIFQKSVPSVWQDIWYALSEVEKRRITGSSTVRSLVSRCCPMPRTNAEQILSMLDSGQLDVLAGLQGVTPLRTGFEIHLSPRRTRVDVLVNAVTPAVYGVHPGASDLVETATRHGLALRHHGGGLRITARSSAVVGLHAQNRIFALGDLTRGAFFFTFGVPVLVRRAADIATAIHHDSHDSHA